MRQITVLSTIALPERLQMAIQDVSSEISLVTVERKECPGSLLFSVSVILGWPPQEWLPKASGLRWLHLPSAGADAYLDRSLYANDDVVVTNSSGVFGIPIAEHVMGMCLCHSRGLAAFARTQKEHRWQRRELKELYGKTMGIVGLGDIGREVAKRAKAFGMKVLAVKRTPGETPEYVDRLLVGESGLEELFHLSQFIVLALPLTKQTEGMVSKELLSYCSPETFLVNVGRGGLVDENALITALQERRLAGAGLDVFQTEPLPPKSPLWEMDNVIITPHNSGSTPEHLPRVTDIFIANLKRFLSGRPLRNQVDWESGY